MKPMFFRKVLSNGMTILFEKRSVPVVSVAFAVRVGGVNETADEKGISHFIEHLLYKGTPKRNSEQIAQEIEKKGGDMNGFTSETITAFWCKMPSNHFNTALDVLGDMIKNPLFDEKEMEKERQVIFEEMKMYRNSPAHYVSDEIHGCLYKGPFGEPIIGTYDTLNNITREKILNKFKETYKPSNLILCVVGDAEFENVIKFAKNNFPNEKGKIQKIKINKIHKSKIEKRKGIDQANFVIAYHIPKANEKRNYAAFLLNVLMAEGMSSRLFHELRGRRNLCYAVKGGSEITKEYAYSLIFVGTKKENLEKAKKLILEEFDKVSKNLTEKELNQVKEQIIGNHKMSTEDSQIQLANLLAYEMNGNAKDLYSFEKHVRNINLDDVKSIAKGVKTKHSFFALVPEGKS